MLTCPHSNKTLQPGSPKLSFSKSQTNKAASFCRTWLTSTAPDLCGHIFGFGMIPLSSATNGTSGACSPKAAHAFKSSRSVIIRLYQQLATIRETDPPQNMDTGRFKPEISLGQAAPSAQWHQDPAPVYSQDRVEVGVWKCTALRRKGLSWQGVVVAAGTRPDSWGPRAPEELCSSAPSRVLGGRRAPGRSVGASR